MRRLPIFFTFSQIVFGNGFIAGVRMSGRALLEEDGEVWINGVAPAGFAGGGVDRAAAFLDFKQGWSGVLFDIAAGASSFEEFRNECEVFLRARSDHLNREWESALDQVRASKYVDETLPTVSAREQRTTFEVCNLEPQESKAAKNEPKTFELATAA